MLTFLTSHNVCKYKIVLTQYALSRVYSKFPASSNCNGPITIIINTSWLPQAVAFAGSFPSRNNLGLFSKNITRTCVSRVCLLCFRLALTSSQSSALDNSQYAKAWKLWRKCNCTATTLRFDASSQCMYEFQNTVTFYWMQLVMLFSVGFDYKLCFHNYMYTFIENTELFPFINIVLHKHEKLLNIVSRIWCPLMTNRTIYNVVLINFETYLFQAAEL